MSIKETVSAGVRKIAEAGKDVDAKTVAFVKKTFHQTHEACDKSGASLKTATEETLAGVAAGLKSAGHQTGHLVGKCAQAISDDTRKATEASLAAARKAADHAKASLAVATKKAVEHSKDGVNKAEEDTRAAMTSAYADLQKKISQAEAHLKDVTTGINAYAKSSAHDLDAASRKAMHDAAHQTQAALVALEKAAKEHSKTLLHHSEEKLSQWLDNLKAKLGHRHHKV